MIITEDTNPVTVNMDTTVITAVSANMVDTRVPKGVAMDMVEDTVEAMVEDMDITKVIAAENMVIIITSNIVFSYAVIHVFISLKWYLFYPT